MTDIPAERIERAARVIFRGFLYPGECGDKDEFDQLWNCSHDKRNEALYHARAALHADAPEIAAAEIRGLEMAKEIAKGQQASDLNWGQRYPNDHESALSRSDCASDIASAIDARIAELKAKTEPAE